MNADKSVKRCVVQLRLSQGSCAPITAGIQLGQALFEVKLRYVSQGPFRTVIAQLFEHSS